MFCKQGRVPASSQPGGERSCLACVFASLKSRRRPRQIFGSISSTASENSPTSTSITMGKKIASSMPQKAVKSSSRLARIFVGRTRG